MNSATALATFLRLMRLLPPARALLLGLLMVLVSLTEGIGLLLLVPLIGLVSGDTADAGPAQAVVDVLSAIGVPLDLAGVLMLFLALVAARTAIQFAREELAMRIERGLIDDFRARSYAALLHTEWRWLANSRRTDHAHVLLSNIDRIGVAVTQGIALVSTVLTMAAYMLVAASLSWPMTLIVAVTGLIVFILLGRQRRHAHLLGQQLSDSKRAMFRVVDQGLAGMKLTRILGNEHRQIDQFGQAMLSMRAQAFAYATSLNLSRAMFQLGAALLLAAYLYVGLTWWRLPVPELLTLVLLFGRAVPMLQGLQATLFAWLHAVPAVHEAERLLAETEAAAEPVVDPAPDRAIHNRDDDWRLERELRLESVSLQWDGRDRPALDAVSLQLPARSTLAVIGPSGSGKSTLADVIMGLLVPDGGTLSVDGKVVEGGGRQTWRRAIAYVPQDVILFHDTIRANLAWGLPQDNAGADAEAAMAEALHRAAAEFVHALPDGLDTIVGDGGMRLSGGERQRIALARALLRQPSLLILDEATSALDPVNELRIRDALARLHGDLTMIVIGHRLPALEHADHVVRMEQGRIVAQGNWADIGGAASTERWPA